MWPNEPELNEGPVPLEPPEQPIRRTPIIGIATSRTWKLRFYASGFL